MRYCILIALLAMAGCSDDDSGSGSSSRATPSFHIGTNYSPQDWPDDTQIPEGIWYFEAHGPNGSHGNLVGYHGNWRDPQGVSGEPTILAQTAQAARHQFGAEAVLGFGWWDESAGPDLTSTSEPANNTWTNTQTRNEFRQMVADYCDANQPLFVFLGNETNSWWLSITDPVEQAQQWADWVSHFTECYDAIKAVSPGTTVFTVFQLEQMRGNGSRAGWNYTPHWHLIADFGTKLDAVGFTTYPHVEYGTPSEVPADYYDEIANHWSGPVIFTEMSWPANPASPPYNGSETIQADWIERFFELVDDMDVLYANHAFLHDPPTGTLNPAFTDAGLRSNDGAIVRPADAVWQAKVQELR
jgi:hypothetical protein